MWRLSSGARAARGLESLLQGRSVRRIRQLEKALRWTKASFGATMMVCAVAFVTYQSIQTKKTLAAKEREKENSDRAGDRERAVEKGDFWRPVPFARAAVLDSLDSLDSPRSARIRCASDRP